jgi:hypothetical protein
MSWIDLKQPTSAARPCRAGAPSAEPGDGARQRRREAPLLTMNTYTHVLPEIEREAIDAAAKMIFE